MYMHKLQQRTDSESESDAVSSLWLCFDVDAVIIRQVRQLVIAVSRW